MLIRDFRSTDLEGVVSLFTASVHGIADRAYKLEQLQAWVPRAPDLDYWRRKLAGQKLLLAEQEGELLGMIAYEANGHIDVLFTRPNHVRKGIAQHLHAYAERLLTELGVFELFSEASEVARPFFLRQGYRVEDREVVTVRGVDMHRYRMRLNTLGRRHAGDGFHGMDRAAPTGVN